MHASPTHVATLTAIKRRCTRTSASSTPPLKPFDRFVLIHAIFVVHRAIGRAPWACRKLIFPDVACHEIRCATFTGRFYIRLPSVLCEFKLQSRDFRHDWFYFRWPFYAILNPMKRQSRHSRMILSLHYIRHSTVALTRISRRYCQHAVKTLDLYINELFAFVKYLL